MALTLGAVANGLRLRQRLSQLGRIDDSPGPDDDEDFVLVARPGVEVTPSTRSAVARYASREALDVLDLVPADLSADDALDLARAVDTTTYRSAPLAKGGGARHAVLVRAAVAERMGLEAPADRAAFVDLMERLKQHAARSSDLAMAPGLRAAGSKRGERLDELKALYRGAYPAALAIPAVRSALLLAGPVLSPGWGLAALAAYGAQPYLATSASPVHPERSLGSIVRRVTEPLALANAGRSRPRATDEVDPVDAGRAAYAAEMSGGIERFFEDRRNDCPWCGSTALVERLRTPDLMQYKPGEFVLDECTTCGLLFQNPRLSIDGLNFYYRDFYDGLGAEGVEYLFTHSERSYRGRVELVRRHVSPRAWLDVGSGYGHFCVVARGFLPETTIDGLDMGTSIEESARRGWIDTGFRGLFPDMVDELKGRYDVVSMHHYLEHTTDPRAELEAAYDVLEPGGHLLIEVPDPSSRAPKLLGKYWIPWTQPQHLQFLSVAHLTAALETQGFEIVEIERGAAHQPVDLGGAVLQFANLRAGPPRSPWLDRPTAAQNVRRAAVLAALAPIALSGMLVDRLLLPVIEVKGEGWSNAYRVLARRP